MLLTLKQQLSPSTKARERELIIQYRKLQQPPRFQNTEVWLRKWQQTYNKYRILCLPDVKGDRAVRDFVFTVSTVKPAFAGY